MIKAASHPFSFFPKNFAEQEEAAAALDKTEQTLTIAIMPSAFELTTTIFKKGIR